jgi:hypothetical protein
LEYFRVEIRENDKVRYYSLKRNRITYIVYYLTAIYKAE